MTAKPVSECTVDADQHYVEGAEPSAPTVAKEQEAVTEAPRFKGMTCEQLEAAAPTEPPAPAPPFRAMTKQEHDARFAQVQIHQAPPSGPIRKVAILGFTDSWKYAPFDDPTWEIWGLNELYMFIPRWTRWFELHQEEVWMADTKRTLEHRRKLAAMTCPVYMQQHLDDIPCSVSYPLQQVAEAFPNPGRGIPYLTNSISLMLGLALLEGFEEIMICGVDMAHDSEYCVAPETRILTSDLRWVPLSDVQVGQELIAFDEDIPARARDGKPAQFRKYRKAVVEVVQQLTRPCHRLEMADGTTLVSSSEHRWLTVEPHGGRQWTETLHLKCHPPNRISKIVKLMNVWGENRSRDEVAVALQRMGFDYNSVDNVPILRNESIGDQPVIGLKTTTGTFIAEGFASHNSHQRPSCEYFIGIAQGRGVKITLPPECELLKTDFIYGYQTAEIHRWNERMLARERDFEAKLNSVDQQMAQLQEARAQYRGALQDTQHIRKNWKGLLAA